MLFRQMLDRETSTYTYIIADLDSKEAILIDPVIERVERDLQQLSELGVILKYCLETHIHADHVTGTAKLRELTHCQGVVPDGASVSCADLFIQDRENLKIGAIAIQAIATPGHTDNHMAYLVDRTHLLSGDALLIRGCGRTDFQGGDAGRLFDSVTERLFTLPDRTLVYPAHDYRGLTGSTIGEEKLFNPRFVGRSRQQFIEFMTNLNLPDPQQMAAAIPANEHCGNLTSVNQSIEL
ncbi:MBL fold metallo-hydrolase [Chamaesiphon sp. GL140_3_metabinner_50]|uniref:MBL fold metallo-hydrolase n=1 Tax=Chamaesiphon sp. GL140_3_metabinner_50 TaxID=2970812 RepID=UPI0025FA48DD|nr:MBL fold metallo-hydrolase [Chamaesiphon sp. GL140_3_metabinner_50]